MTPTQILCLAIGCAVIAVAILCYATLWAEPREEDPAPPADLVDFDEERL